MRSPRMNQYLLLAALAIVAATGLARAGDREDVMAVIEKYSQYEEPAT